jgi:hypothetical protein
MTRQQRLQGQVIVDFVNAENADEGLSKVFENIQVAFGLSRTFHEEAQKRLPFSSSDIDELVQKIDSLLDIPIPATRRELELRCKVQSSLDKLLDMSHHEVVQYAEVGSRMAYGSWHDMAIFNIAEEIGTGQGTKDVYDNLKKFYEEEICDCISIVIEIFAISIKKLQEEFREMLDLICQNSPDFKRRLAACYLDIYNSYSKMIDSQMTKLVLDEDDLLVETPIDEERLLDIIQSSTYDGDEFKHWFPNILNCCLIEFMKSNDYRSYLGKCRHCKKFFIAIKGDSKQHCSTNCRMQYHHSKPEYRERKAAAQRKKYGWKKSVNAK